MRWKGGGKFKSCTIRSGTKGTKADLSQGETGSSLVERISGQIVVEDLCFRGCRRKIKCKRDPLQRGLSVVKNRDKEAAREKGFYRSQQGKPED